MTLKEIRAKQLSKVVLEAGGNLAEAGRILGVTKQAIQKRMKSPLVRKTIAEILNKDGVTDRFLSRLIKAGCKATKLIFIGNLSVDMRGKTIKTEKVVEDHQIRHKFIVTALQLKGHLKLGVEENQHYQPKVFDMSEEEVKALDFKSLLSYHSNALLNQRR